MSKANRRLLILVVVLAVLVAAALAVLLAPMIKQNGGGDGFVLSASRHPDGSWQLTWPRFSATGMYSVSVRKGTQSVFSKDGVGGESITLPAELDGGRFIVSISGTDPSDGKRSITVSDRITFADMPVKDLKTEFDGEKGTLYASWNQNADSFLVYEVFGDRIAGKMELDSPEAELCFNGSDGFSLPPEDGTAQIGIAGIKKQGHVKVTGSMYRIARLDRKDFTGFDLHLECEANSDNTVTVSWQKTEAGSYELLFAKKGEELKTIASVDGECLSYRTPRLEPLQKYEFRLRAVSSDGRPVCEETAEADTEITPLYSVIWLNRKLPVFSNPDKSGQIGEAGPDGTFCVLDEDTGYGTFKIRLSDGVYGWVDSRYCMINLPDYIGDLVSYDITNSYSSMFTFHEYEIAGLTGKTVPGYESVRQKNGEYLVPLLYPTAKKLASAAADASEQGLRLRIYDTYRPKESTLSIYETAVAVLDDPLPSSTWTGNTVSKPPASGGGRNFNILRDFVENSGWGMSAFLGYGGSNHNRGAAIDMGLEDLQTREIKKAQTIMHDLSVYSTTANNNYNAIKLKDIMTAAGFGNLSSEWWHFEDVEAMNSFNPSFRDKGVSARGWYFDGTGWQYRDELGSCLKGVSMTENGKEYRFNSDGYLA